MKLFSGFLNRFSSIWIILIFFNPLTDSSQAQNEKIIKIWDSNLFELSSGQLIKIANIDVPNIYHPDLRLRNVGIDAFNFAKNKLFKRKLKIEFISEVEKDTLFLNVKLVREYPLGNIDFAQKYLEKGFGKLLRDSQGRIDTEYGRLMAEAQEDKIGIWEIENHSDSLLDQFLLQEGKLISNPEEYLKENTPPDNLFLSKLNGSESVYYEVIAAPLVGIPMALLGGFTGAAVGTFGNDSGIESLRYMMWGGYLGYAFGNAFGVYLVAKNGEREVNLTNTFAASIFGAVLGIGFYSVSQNDLWENEIGNYLLLSLPGLASIIYVNLIAEKRKINDNRIGLGRDLEYFKTAHITHSDFYNSKKIFDINILRINF